MKFTWGHGIMIALGCFMVFITTLVVMGGNMGEMVEDNYYEKTVNYQDEIDAAKRANAMTVQPEIITQANGFLIKFPNKIQEGEVFLMRSESSDFDIRQPLKLNNRNEHLISSATLIDGEYIIRISWVENQQKHLIKKTIKWTTPSTSQP